VIGFGARTLDGSTPKYLNTPETSVYSKSDSLYGIHLARKKGRETGHIFVVEGYFDFLSLYIRGVENTVATLGTALTSSHAKKLKTCCKCAVLVFDSDEAGIRAAKKGIGIFKDVGMEVKILVLPSGYDPDKFILEKGPEELQKAKDNALSGMNFLIGLAIKKHGLTIEGKIKIVSELASALAGISDSVERSLYIKELSQRIDVEEAAIREKISREADEALRRNRGHRRRLAAEEKSGKQRPGVHTKRFEKKLIAMLLQYPEIAAEMRNRNLIDCFENPELKALGQSILEYVEKKHFIVSDLIQSFSDDREKNMIASLSMGDEFQSEQDCLRLIDHFQTTVYLRDQSLLNEIKESYSRKDTKNLQELMLKKLEMARRMQKKTSTH
jgi:DNA primase